MRFRFGLLTMVIVLLASACGSSGGGSGDSGLGGATTTTVNANTAACKSAKLTSPEKGVTADTITVTVVADDVNVVRPGLFLGSMNGLKAWGDYINSQGGLACRKVVVKTADSKLSQTEAANAVTAACGNSLALVGTTALFLNDMTPIEKCKDKAGATTGIPDLAELQTEAAQQCSPMSFAILPNASSCPYDSAKGGKRTFKVGYTQYDYYFNKYGADALHGVFVIPSDLPSTKAATMPIYRAENQMGIKSDAEYGKSGQAIQSDYTEVVKAIKSNKSTYARSNLDYKGTVLLRKEAAAQGVDTVKVWDCSLQCYDKRLIGEGKEAVNGQYVWLNFLPFEDGATNPELARFLKYDKSPDAFGMQSWIAGEAFARAINDTMAANGNDPNSITRVNLLKAIRNMHDFDAGGLIPQVDIGNKIGSTCIVGMQVQNGKFVRVDPAPPGTFDCDNNKPPLELTIDPVAEYHG